MSTHFDINSAETGKRLLLEVAEFQATSCLKFFTLIYSHIDYLPAGLVKATLQQYLFLLCHSLFKVSLIATSKSLATIWDGNLARGFVLLLYYCRIFTLKKKSTLKKLLFLIWCYINKIELKLI